MKDLKLWGIFISLIIVVQVLVRKGNQPIGG